jgi:hypothetical protein
MDRTAWIFLQHAPRRDSRGPVLFIVVVLIHVGIIATLADSARTRFSRKRSDPADPIIAFFLASPALSTSASSNTRSPHGADLFAPGPEQSFSLPSAIDVERASDMPNLPEITVPPDEHTDSRARNAYSDLEAAARAAIARQAQREVAPRIGAHPEGMKPPTRPNHAPGETQDVGNGEVLTWVDDYCFFSNRVKPRSNGIGGVKPLCVDRPPSYQSLEEWVKSRRKLADERGDD